jgi:serine/threonine protein kinase
MAPSRIAGRYELQQQLGEGGMGVVWRALDTKTGSYVAVKVMKDISDPLAVEFFTKEWRALAEMCHPNIVDVRDVDVIEENRQKKPFFVMPLLRGATLAELIADASARLTLGRIVEIITQVCRGLQAAHQRGLVHRDLKPSNIFVMEDDTAKIIDFGVVHLAGSKSVTGQKGTFQYMSPEQAQLREITPASDLFSVGVILYEALTGRKPFACNTAEGTMEAVIKYIPPPVSEINPSINQSVSRVVHKCLAKQPIHRFANARELAETLQKAFRNEPVFDTTKIEPRIERAKAAFRSGDEVFASEILAELEAEGNLDPRITVLRTQIDSSAKQKKIRQLLESARARMEQDEIPLALDKLREVLELDPQNADGLAMRHTMEKQRSETQIAKWMELAQTHLGHRDFSAARHAVQEVLAIRGGDTRAFDLLEKIESTEADAKRIRDQKEQLYNSAIRAYQNGEIETALSKLERLFSVAQTNPNAAIPERDAVYQSFYNEVRSEHDFIHSALEDAQRQFSERNFAGAMAVCCGLLVKYPNDGIFQALKIRIEDAERQELSAYIAEVSKRVESEPDLDRRVNILREACERYPNEAQFAQQLKLIRERRDLVNSIVAKARQYEERGQHVEAISQWDILRNIHPQYPGIAFELAQCKEKRDRQAREDEHSRLVQEIDGLMQGRAYTRAIECASAAMQEFPGDTELGGLRTLAEQALERAKQSRWLFEEAQRVLTEKDPDRAAELLRRSFSLDPRGPGLRDSLVTVLAERARTLVDQNWREAESLYQEANELDSSHPAVRALRSSLSEAKRQAFVGQCLADCRALVAAGNPQAAAERVRAARAEYPNDLRLEQYAASLQKELNEARRREEKAKDTAVLAENRQLLEQNPDRANLRAILERSYAIRAKQPDDAEIGQIVAEFEMTARRVAGFDDLSQLFRMEPALTGTDSRSAVMSAPRLVPPRVEERKGPTLVEKAADKTSSLPEQVTRKESVSQVVLREVGAFAGKVPAFVGPAGKWYAVGMAAMIVLMAVAAYIIIRMASPPRPIVVTPRPTQGIRITALPPDSTITSDGKSVSDGVAAIGATIEVSRVGYKTKRVQIQQESDGNVTLEPEPVHLSIQIPENGGTVQLDGQKIADLSGGLLDEYDLPPDGTTHKLSVAAQGKQIFIIDFKTPAGSRPRLVEMEGTDAFAVTSLGNVATVYGGNALRNIQFRGQNIAVGAAGADLNLNEENSEVKFGEGSNVGSVAIDVANAPGLAVHSLNANGQIVIKANVDKATLTVDGVAVRRRRNGWIVSRPPGSHNFVLSAEGYVTQEWSMTTQRRQAMNKTIALTPKAAAATVAALVITGGTPGAEVELDGNRVGELDESGNLRLSNVLTAGKHVVALLKAGYEARMSELDVKPPSEGILNDVKLSASAAMLTFETDVKSVMVKYRRVGEAQFSETAAPNKVAVAPGSYEIVAHAPGFQEFHTQENVGRENIAVALKLVAVRDFLFQDPDQLTHEGEWIKAKKAGAYVNLKPGMLHENLIFARPGKTLLWNKKVEWLIETSERHTRVQYAIEGQKLTRRLVVGEQTSDAVETKADTQSASQNTSLSVHVAVEGAHVRITNDKGIVLDDFTATGQDFTNGRIGLRTDSQFIVWSDNQ